MFFFTRNVPRNREAIEAPKSHVSTRVKKKKNQKKKRTKKEERKKETFKIITVFSEKK